MPAFYDYDMVIGRDGIETYKLRRNTKPLGLNKLCTIFVGSTEGRAHYTRVTQWGSPSSRRYELFHDLDLAMRSGTDWAIRRRKQDAS